MKLEQNTITTIIADEGKVLRRKSDGTCFGDRITLGYNYYEAGILREHPYLERPDDYEEVDAPEDDAPVPTDHVKRLQRMAQLVERARAEINNLPLSATQALAVADWFPEIGTDIPEGSQMAAGTRFRYNGQLWQALIDHQLLPMYAPGPDTAEYYRPVSPNDDIPEEILTD